MQPVRDELKRRDFYILCVRSLNRYFDFCRITPFMTNFLKHSQSSCVNLCDFARVSPVYSGFSTGKFAREYLGLRLLLGAAGPPYIGERYPQNRGKARLKTARAWCPARASPHCSKNAAAL